MFWKKKQAVDIPIPVPVRELTGIERMEIEERDRLAAERAEAFFARKTELEARLKALEAEIALQTQEIAAIRQELWPNYTYYQGQQNAFGQQYYIGPSTFFGNLLPGGIYDTPTAIDMLYEKQSFTLPTTNRKMTDEEYEIAVGIRPAKDDTRTTPDAPRIRNPR